MRHHRFPTACAVLTIWLAACVPLRHSQTRVPSSVDVRVVTDEADAAIAILEKLSTGRNPDSADWRRLSESTGYRLLKVREASIGRAFTDSSFRAFMLSDTLLRRTRSLSAALSHYRSLDVGSAAAQALAYLPRGARIEAALLPMIKPRTNSFVFTADSVAAIFLYVDPQLTPAKELNTITHELHHIGFGTVCDMTPDPAESAPMQMLRQRMFGFGEGLAMLAAAGSPDVHPHAASDTADRNRWDRDMKNVSSSMSELDHFFLSVADDTTISPDSVLQRAMSFYGVQGPWYTVGWLMASTIERVDGRRRLLEIMCSPLQLMREYNRAATALNARGNATLPLWSDSVLVRLAHRSP